jgi:hypothetical protein
VPFSCTRLCVGQIWWGEICVGTAGFVWDKACVGTAALGWEERPPRAASYDLNLKPRAKLPSATTDNYLVPSKGLEPPHRCRYMDLNHARLPIPPRWQSDLTMQRRPRGRRVRKTFLFYRHGRDCQTRVCQTCGRIIPASRSSKFLCSILSTRDSPFRLLPHISGRSLRRLREPFPRHRCGSM